MCTVVRPMDFPPHFTRPRRTPIRSVSRAAFEHELAQRVARSERRYEMPSADMLASVRNGACRETADIAEWLLWYQLLRRVAGTDDPS
jgi:hypothetical protein